MKAFDIYLNNHLSGKALDVYLSSPFAGRTFDICLNNRLAEHNITICSLMRYRLLRDMDETTLSSFDDMSLEELYYVRA